MTCHFEREGERGTETGPVEASAIRQTAPRSPSRYRETDADSHAEDVWHVRYDGQDFRDG